MSRGRYRSTSRGYYGSRSYALQRALAHIAAAKRLTAQLGGMDQAVKAYFFALPPSELAAVLDEYERRYGRPAREYAANTIPKWRTGRVQMGGMIAERLFNLLPPRMPLAVKFKLVEGLWHHVGLSSKYQLRVTPDANVAQIVESVRLKISEFVANYKIPPDLERRFDWLAAGDVAVKQLLLGHIQEIEKTVAVEAIRAQLPVMLEHLRSAGSHTGRLAQIVRAGQHELEIVMCSTVTKISAEKLDKTMSSRFIRICDAILIYLIVILCFMLMIIFQSYIV